MREVTPTPCSAIQDLIIDNAVAQMAFSRDVTRHLEACESCRAFAIQWEQVIAARRRFGTASLAEPDVARMWSKLAPRVRELARPPETSRWRQLWGSWTTTRWYVVGSAAATAALLIIVSRMGPEQTPQTPALELAQVVRHVGRVQIADGVRVRDAISTAPSPLRVSETLRTGTSSRAQLKVRGHDVVTMPDTELLLARLAHAEVGLELRHGGALIQVRPSDNDHVWLRSPRGKAEVMGTLFAIVTRPSEDTVTVLRGSVRVTSANVERGAVVRSGFCARITDTGIRIEAVAAGTTNEWQQMLDAEDWNESPSATVPAPETFEKPEPAHPGLRKLRALVDKQTAVTAPQDDAAAKAVDALLAQGECEQTLSAVRSMAPQGNDTERADTLMRIADCYLAAHASGQALELYQQIARQFPKSLSGQNATYESGRVALGLGDRGTARRAFQNYLVRYPRGALAPEALYRTCVLDMEAKRADAALACLRRYRQQHAKGGRGSEALLAQATIQRTLKSDCAAAIRLYDKYLESPDERAEEARTWRDWCKHKLSR